MTSPLQKSEPNSVWPTKAILLYGTFGNNTPAGRRFHRRSMATLAVMVAVFASAALVPREFHSWYWPVLGLSFTYIGLEWWRYLESLDELERRLQMEAAAWTYVVGIAAAMFLGGIQAMFAGKLTPLWRLTPLWLILLEPLRAWRLHRIVRRFQ